MLKRKDSGNAEAHQGAEDTMLRHHIGEIATRNGTYRPANQLIETCCLLKNSPINPIMTRTSET